MSRVVAEPPAQPGAVPPSPAQSSPAQPGAVPSGPAQPSLRRLREFGVRPNRDLGQNFLVDSNILGVIGRAAQLHDSDVVLEIGGGLGVLSEYLAPRAAHLHVVEIDQRLRAALGDALDPFENVSVYWADAMTLELAALRPAPTKVIANLPYGIAAGALLRTIEELPTVTRWVTMVQREVGERLAAPPGSGTYGATSVLAQLAGHVRVLRAIPRTVFRPVPNVDSVLVEVIRTGPAPSLALRALVSGAFAHRRKALARSLVLAAASPGGRGGGPRDGGGGESREQGGTRARAISCSREQIREALLALGHPADARAERLSPEDFRALARLLRV